MPSTEPTAAFHVADGLEVLPLRTPTLPPATRTNCSIVGEERVLVFDPGSPWPDEQATLMAYLGAREVAGVVLTHHHGDHVGGASALAHASGAPLMAHPITAQLVSFDVDVLIEEGERIPVPGAEDRWLDAIFTPGHAPGHLCFQDSASGVVIAGDMVAGTGTIVVAPPEGDMQLYIDSLQRLRSLGARALIPAHGPLIEEPNELIDHYVAHRGWREERIYRALRAQPSDLATITARAYTDVPSALHMLAQGSALAHLNKLVAEGRAVLAEEGLWLPSTAESTG